MNIRNKQLAQQIQAKKERDEEVAKLEKQHAKYLKLLKQQNHIIFNNHKYIQILNLNDQYFNNKSIYVLYNKRVYKLIYKLNVANKARRYDWIDIFDDRLLNVNTLFRSKKEYSTTTKFLTSYYNKYRSGYMFTTSSIKQIINLLYDIKFNNASHSRLSDERLDEALKDKLISKTIYNRLKNNNKILGFTNEVYNGATSRNR